MKKDSIYNLIKKYGKMYDEKKNLEVKRHIKNMQEKFINDYKLINGKRKIENFIIKEEE